MPWPCRRRPLTGLDQGSIRDAEEKAWGATKRATDALVLARTRGATGVSRGDGSCEARW